MGNALADVSGEISWSGRDRGEEEAFFLDEVRPDFLAVGESADKEAEERILDDFFFLAVTK